MKNFYKLLPKPFFALAPMDDVTDTVFRQIIVGLSRPDYMLTEFVNVDGLMSPGRHNLEIKLKFSAQEKPLVAQLWGKNPTNFFNIAQEIKTMGFSGIDLNMGCPDKTVVKNGCCSALINDRQLAKEIILATVEGAGELPVSVKTRLGFNQIDLSWHEFLLDLPIQLLTVHMRTKKDMSKIAARWDYMTKIKQLRDNINPDILLVGNGDVENRQTGLKIVQQYQVDGIMIGRGILKNPLAFSLESDQWDQYSIIQKINLFKSHLDSFSSTYNEYADARLFKLFKFAKLYLNGFNNSSDLRQKIMIQKSVEAVKTILDDFVTSL